MAPARRPAPPPAPDRLPALPVHVVVRRWPETLPLLRERLPSVEEAGAHPLSAVGDDPEGLLEAVLEATRWREGVDP